MGVRSLRRQLASAHFPDTINLSAWKTAVPEDKLEYLPEPPSTEGILLEIAQAASKQVDGPPTNLSFGQPKVPVGSQIPARFSKSSQASKAGSETPLSSSLSVSRRVTASPEQPA